MFLFRNKKFLLINLKVALVLHCMCIKGSFKMENNISEKSPLKNESGKKHLSKISISFSKSDKTKSDLENLITEINQKEFGKRVTPADIFSYMLDKVSKKDIEELQKNSIKSDEDLLKYEWKKECVRNNQDIDFYEWAVKKLKLKKQSETTSR